MNDLTFFLRLSELYASDADERSILRRLATLAVPAFAGGCSAHLLRNDGTIENVAGAEGKFAKLAPDAPMRKALDTGDVVVDSARSLLVAPIMIRGTAAGAIRFTGRAFSDDDALLAADVARRAALAIDNARARAEAAASAQARDLFLATFSHEMKTPLTSILGWTQMLRVDGPSTTLFEEAIDAIEQSARVQQRLIDDLLDISRVITGKLHLEYAAVDVPKLLATAAESLLPRAKENGQHIRVASCVPLAVYGDQARLHQVLWNLLSNAMKFTPAGGLIEVSATADEHTVTICVRDTGRGIRAAVLPHVFDRFHQVSVADRAQHGGLGLGLSIVRNLIELHGGDVTARSEGEGKGSTFCIRLPIHHKREGENQ